MTDGQELGLFELGVNNEGNCVGLQLGMEDRKLLGQDDVTKLDSIDGGFNCDRFI